jgi:hypothetical protein
MCYITTTVRACPAAMQGQFFFKASCKLIQELISDHITLFSNDFPSVLGVGWGEKTCTYSNESFATLHFHVFAKHVPVFSTTELENIHINRRIKPGLCCYAVARVALTCSQVLRLCNRHCEYLQTPHLEEKTDAL